MSERTTLVGIGASAGGVEALLELVAELPAGLPAAVLVVLHQSAASPGVLARLLDRRCALPVVTATHGEPVEAGRVHVAPPDHHLLVRAGHVVVSHGPRENGHRPGIDPLFRSLALEAGPSAVGAVCSGMLDDGAAGLLAIVRHGGTAVVQDPDEALFPGMPRAGLAQVPGALVRPAAGMAEAFVALAERPVIGGRGAAQRLAYEVEVAADSATVLAGAEPPGPPAGLTCPDCSGPLYDLSEDGLLHYRCRVGHAWSQESLWAEQEDRVERALCTALQALEEKASVHHRIAETAKGRGAHRVLDRARDAAHQALASAELVRDLLAHPGASRRGEGGPGER
jgi:two-component system, chemotaxis family, protein-glutamate methylesterase/glutaminase